MLDNIYDLSIHNLYLVIVIQTDENRLTHLRVLFFL